jgi:hypothetical protein
MQVKAAVQFQGASRKPCRGSAQGNRLVSYTYAAAAFFVRLPPEFGDSGTTVSVHDGADCRNESNAVIAGIPSLLPMDKAMEGRREM